MPFVLPDLQPLAVSLRLAATVTAILLVAGVPMAWVFARSRRAWVPWVESLCSLGLVLPPTVLGFYLLVFLAPVSPIGGFLERVFGIRLVFNFAGLVLASCLAGLPFMLSALRAGMLAIPQTLLDAALTLGKGRLTIMCRIVLPLLRPALLAGGVTTFAHTMGEFGVVMMIGGSIPGLTKVVSIAIWERTEAQDLGSAHSYAIILVVFSYAAVYLINRLHNKQRRPP
jgi:molybdate transport system permease protein